MQCSGSASKAFCLRDTAATASQTTNDNEQTLAPSTPKYPSATSWNEETASGERQCTQDDSRVPALCSATQPSPSHLPGTDILGLDSTVQEDGDDELPTFDVFCSLGVEPL